MLTLMLKAQSIKKPHQNNLTRSTKMASKKLDRRITLMNDDNVDTLYHQFLRLDTDGNGVLDKNELLAIPELQENPLAHRVLELFDTDGDGVISFTEFVTGLSIFSSKGNRAKKLKFAFDLYDIDKDGYISNGELYAVLHMMVGESSISEEQLQQVVDKTIRDSDSDEDGKLNFMEFSQVLQRHNPSFVTKWCIADI